ncbi:SpaA isopeptide-forming pilin-related protein [Clostridium sp. B9]|uniref:SpaA isopeptide-forming pilin-related protein n=1 Tax=Clostridium sp. B9 TaxID=3423224 RepID=UPI003D2E9D7B
MKQKTKYKLRKALVLFLTLTMVTWEALPISNVFAYTPESELTSLGNIEHYNAVIFGNQTSGRADSEGALAIQGNLIAPNSAGYGYSVCAAGNKMGKYMGFNYESNGMPSLLLGGTLSKGANTKELTIEAGPVVISNEQSDPNGNTMKLINRAGQTPITKSHSEIMNQFQVFKAQTDKFISQAATLKTNKPIKESASWANYLGLGYDETHNNILVSSGLSENDDDFGPIYLPKEAGTADFVVIYSKAKNITFDQQSICYDGEAINPGDVYNGSVDTGKPENATLHMLAKKLIWVFPNAETVAVNHKGVIGSVIAPNATVNADGGSINGQLIAKNFNQYGGMEMHNFFFNWDKWNNTNFAQELGEVKLIKSDSENSKEFLSGAEFEIVRANNNVVDKNQVIKSGLTTDKNGEISYGELPFGQYAFIETKAPTGYVLNSNPIFFTVSEANPSVTVNATNEKEISAKLIKSDLANSNIKLEGAIFNVVSILDGQPDFKNPVQTNLVTDKNGEIIVHSLKPGKYAFVETKAPEKYEIIGDSESNIYKFDVVNDGNQSTYETVNVSNKKIPVGTVVLTKTDEANGKKLEGVTFNLLKDGVVVKSGLKTDSKGQITVTKLESGNYSFKETATIDGYVLDTKATEEKAVDSNNSTPVEFTMTNKEKTGGAILTKTDEANNNALAGATFSVVQTIKEADGTLKAGKVIKAGLVTNSEGKITVDGLAPGEYAFLETEAPEGYTIGNKGSLYPFTVVFNQKDKVNVSATNKKIPVGNIVLTKTSEGTNRPLKGVTFKLLDGKGNKVDLSGHADASSIDKNGNLVTDANGEIKVYALDSGEYSFVEVSTLDGYVLDKKPTKAVKVDSNDNTPVPVNVTNKERTGKASLLKTDADTGKVLSGATFKVVNVIDGKVQPESIVKVNGKELIGTTDENGKLTVSGLIPGNYAFMETAAPKGYSFDKNKAYPFTIDFNQQEANIPTVKVSNSEIRGAVELTKVDSDTGLTIPGAEFKIVKAENGKVLEPEQIVQEGLKVGVTGTLTATNLLPGQYAFIETAAPTGYELSKEVKIFNIEFNPQSNATVEFSNTKKKGSALLTKKDDLTKEALKGVKFNLLDESGKIIKSKLETDINGQIKVDGLNPGTYYFEEQEALPGYNLNKEKIKVVINFNPSDEPVKVDAYNTEKTGGAILQKTDSNNGKVIENATFNLVNVINGKADLENPIKSGLKTDKNGQISVSDLNPGKYAFIETKAADGYDIGEKTEFDFTVDFNQAKPILVKATNEEKRGEALLVKTDLETGKVLAGATFKVVQYVGNSENLIAEKLVTNSKGEIYIDNLLPGNYAFIETDAPDGYDLDITPHRFTVDFNPSKVVTVNVTNAETAGSVILTKKDALMTSKVIQGATFSVYKATEVSGETKLGDLVQEGLVTNEKGQISVGGLKPGTYAFVETSAADGYKLDKTPIPFTIELNQQKAVEVEALNEQIPGSVVLTKIDSLTKKPIEGVKFNLVDKATNKAVNTQPLITNAKGKITVENLKPGKYEFVEIEAKEGYDLNNTPVEADVTFNQKAPTEVSMENSQKTGGVILTKNDAQTSDIVSGAKFNLVQVTMNDGKEDFTNVIQKGLITNDSGQITVDGLTPGKYAFIETYAPEGYELDSTPLKFTIDFNQKELVKVNALNNEETGTLILEKTDSLTKKAIKGAKFNLINSKGVLVGEGLETDENGKITVDNLLPDTYKFIETYTPDGYVLDSTPVMGEVVFNQKTPKTVVMTNDEKAGGAILTKTDKQTKNVVPGATFNVVKVVDGQANLNNAVQVNGVDLEKVTDISGQISVDGLTPGEYAFIETNAPDGYELDQTPVKFTISFNQQEPVRVSTTNSEKTGGAILTKTDSDTGKVLKGATFKVVKVVNGEVDLNNTVQVQGKDLIKTTDEDGQIKVEGLLPGEYAFVETSAPEGYELDKTPINFTVDFNQQELCKVNASNKEIRGSVVLTKKDGNTGLNVPGAVVKIVKVINGEVNFEQVVQSNLTTGVTGTLIASNLVPGEYAFVETSAPKGYELNETPVKFTIGFNQKESAKATLVNNQREGSIILTKTDAQTNSPLAGVKFDLLDSKGNVVNKEPLVTDQNGTITVNNLAPGDYSFEEVEALPGYIKSTDKVKAKVEFNPQGPTKVSMKNNEKTGALVLTKLDGLTKKALEGVKFNLLDSKGNTIRENLETDKNGQIKVNGLIPGDYSFVETKELAGYVIDKTPVKATVDFNQSEPKEIQVINAQKQGGAILIKKDSNNGKFVKDAVFEVVKMVSGKADLENPVKTGLITNENGQIIVDGLNPGDYAFVETKAPEGYVLNQKPYTFTVDFNQAKPITVNAENAEKTGGAVLTKSDLDTGKVLEGATFKVVKVVNGEVDLSSIVQVAGQELVKTTDKNGQITVNGLVPGEYAFVETKAPEGYVLDTTPIKFTVDFNQQSLAKVEAKNAEIAGSVILTKKDASDKNIVIQGAVFNLVKMENGKADLKQVVKEGLVTDNNGKITVGGLKPGDYAFVETIAPDGYKLDSNPIAFNIAFNQKQPTEVEALNDQVPGSVILTKTDSLTKKPLEGVKFNLLDSKGNIVKEGLVTDKDGKIVVENLHPGDYNFVEVEALEGYVKDTNPVKATITFSQDAPVQVSMENAEKTGGAILVKTDKQTGKTLKGASFNVVQVVDGQADLTKIVKENLVTDENGQIKVEGLNPGDYAFVETKAPAGYELDKTPIKFTVQFNQEELVQVNATNSEKTGVAILTKVDAQSKKPLKGVTFNLVNSKGTLVQEGLVTDENGQIKVEGLLPGEYSFIETKTLDGYVLDRTPVNVTIELNQQEPAEVTMTNTKELGGVLLTKIDSSTKNPLEGVTFNLLNSKGEIVKEGLVTNKNGEISVNGLVPGEYSFVETKALEGYVLNNAPTKFTINFNQKKIVNVTVENAKKQISTVEKVIDTIIPHTGDGSILGYLAVIVVAIVALLAVNLRRKRS